MYADNLTHYLTAKKSEDLIVALQLDVDWVAEWLDNNKLFLNVKKTKLLVMGNVQSLTDFEYIVIKLQGKLDDRVDKIKYLGATQDEKFS